MIGRPKISDHAACHPDRPYYARGMCATCYSRVRRRKPVGRAQARVAHLKYTYGITEEELTQRLADQGGLCACCQDDITGHTIQRRRGKREVEVANAHVDHLHGTKIVRGLLCGPCNMTIGMQGDNPTRLEACAAYLRRVS